jgi:hypothetical protein
VIGGRGQVACALDVCATLARDVIGGDDMGGDDMGGGDMGGGARGRDGGAAVIFARRAP